MADTVQIPQIPPSHIRKFKLVGVGSYGEVFEGRCRGLDVAIKISKSKSPEDISLFQQEIQITSQLRHPNIVLFIGAVTIPGVPMQLITELLDSNLEMLLTNRHRQLSLSQRLQLSFDCISAINWIHLITPNPLIHRDIRCSNFLIDDSLRVKLCDFGLSVYKTKEPLSIQISPDDIHSPSCLAPEVYEGLNFDEKSDIYSFGIVFWEVLTRLEAYADLATVYPQPKQLLDAVCNKSNPLRPPLSVLSPGVTSSTKEILESCWDPNPKRRPRAADIIEEIRERIDSLAIMGPGAREFWEENFGKKTKVLWSEFHPLFSQCLQTSFNSTFLACLQYLLSRGEDEVKMEDFGEIIDFFGPFNRKYGDKYFYKNLKKITKQPWFFGRIGPIEAAARLIDSPIGSFLVRFSTSTRGNFIITLKNGNGVIDHYCIEHVPLSFVFKMEDRIYGSLVDCINGEMDGLGMRESCIGSFFHLLMKSLGCGNGVTLMTSTGDLHRTPRLKRSNLSRISNGGAKDT